MKKNFFTCARYFFAFAVISLAAFSAKADMLKPVSNLEVRLDKNWKDSTNGFVAQLVWQYDKSNSDLKGFKIYEAKGKTQNTADFSLAATIDLSHQEDFWISNDSVTFAYLNTTFNKASYYVTAYGGNQETDADAFGYAEVMMNYYYNLTLSNYVFPVIGVEYHNTVSLVTNAEYTDLSFKLKESPDGMTIDENTGEIVWTPTAKGAYNFTVQADFKVDGDERQANISPAGWVMECANPGAIYGTITDSTGKLIENGLVFAYTNIDTSLDSSNYHNPQNILVGQIQNGHYYIGNVDKGNYYLLAQDQNERWGDNLPTWFETTIDMNSARAVTVNCGDSTVADWSLIPHHKIEPLHFTTYPSDSLIKLGQTFKYDADATGGFDYHPLAFEIISGPDGATMDRSTGELEFTPTENGIFEFSLRVTRDPGANVDFKETDYQRFDLVVRKCDQLSSISMEFKDKDGNKVLHGQAVLFQPDNNKNPQNLFFTHTKFFDNGEVKFDGLDAGTYYLQVKASLLIKTDSTGTGKDSITILSDNYYPQLYKDAYYLADATPIVIDCNTNFSDEMTLKLMEKPNNYTISGTVTDEADNTPIKHAYLQFTGTEKTTGQISTTAVMSDEHGNYTIVLPDNFTWIIYCQANGLFNGRLKDSLLLDGKLYMPEYYDNVTDSKDAKVFDLTENLTGIDFALAELPPYDNSISGKTVNSEGTGISNTNIIAYLVQAADNSIDKLYFGRSADADQDGAFKIDNLIPGKYILFAWDNSMAYAPGYYLQDSLLSQYWEAATQVTVNDTGNSGDYTLKMDVMKNEFGICSVHGMVGRNKNTTKVGDDVLASDALQGAIVYVTDLQGKSVGTMSTKEDGSFGISNLAPGTYRLVAGKIGYSTYSGEFTVGSDNPAASEEVHLSSGTNGVNDQTGGSSSLMAYPNPAGNMLTVKFMSTGGNTTVKMLDNTGRIVYNLQVQTQPGENEVSLQVSNLTQGAYFVVIGSNAATNMIPVSVIK